MRKVFTFLDHYEEMKDGVNKPVEGVEDNMKEWTSNKSIVIFDINLNLLNLINVQNFLRKFLKLSSDVTIKYWSTEFIKKLIKFLPI